MTTDTAENGFENLIVAGMCSAQPHLNAEKLGAALIFLPPLPEQAADVEYLDQATAYIDTAIDHARCESQLLRE